MKRLALVTCRALPHLYEEESALPALLRARGVAAEVVAWDDAAVDWAGFDAVVLRSTWDYFERYGEFRAWLERVATVARVHNSPTLVRWNSDKRYLLELALRGVRIVPTWLVEAGAQVSLAHEAGRRQWSRVVIKPAVSGGAHRTHLCDAQSREGQALLDGLCADGAALVQPFFPEIKADGELSFFFFDGALSHAIVKRPTASDYRVQMQFGGTAHPIDPAPLLPQVQRVLHALPERPAYARIDGVVRDGAFHLMEAELIEPYLFLSAADEAATTAYVDLLQRLADR